MKLYFFYHFMRSNKINDLLFFQDDTLLLADSKSEITGFIF